MNKQLFKILGVCAMVLFATVTHAQTRTITGKVVDEKSHLAICIDTQPPSFGHPCGFTYSLTTFKISASIYIQYQIDF